MLPDKWTGDSKINVSLCVSIQIIPNNNVCNRVSQIGLIAHLCLWGKRAIPSKYIIHWGLYLYSPNA